MDHLLPLRRKRSVADKSLSAGVGKRGIKVAMPMGLGRMGGL